MQTARPEILLFSFSASLTWALLVFALGGGINQNLPFNRSTVQFKAQLNKLYPLVTNTLVRELDPALREGVRQVLIKVGRVALGIREEDDDETTAEANGTTTAAGGGQAPMAVPVDGARGADAAESPTLPVAAATASPAEPSPTPKQP